MFRHPPTTRTATPWTSRAGLISCEHRGRCVSRTEHDGSRTVLAETYEGRRLNSPNDVVVKSDGSIWFTDPDLRHRYGLRGRRGHSRNRRLLGLSARPGDCALSVVVADMYKPNGLAFSPDESLLYVVDSASPHDTDVTPKNRVYPVAHDRQSLGGPALGEGKLFSVCDAGIYDGLRSTRRAISGARRGRRALYSPRRTTIGKIPVPEIVANVCFGGIKRNRLFICGQTSLYSLFLNAQGIAPC